MKEVNVYLVLENIVHKDDNIMKYLEFCCKLAWLFIDNELTRDEAGMERLAKKLESSLTIILQLPISQNILTAKYGSLVLFRCAKLTSAKEKPAKTIPTALALCNRAV